MGKLQKDSSGFSAVETVLVLVLIAIIGFVGWYVWKAKSNTSSTYNSSTSTLTGAKPAAKKTTTAKPADPYAGWKTSTLKLEKLTFKYPSSWTLKDSSDSANDSVVLSGSNNFQMTIGAGTDISAVSYPSGGSSVVKADNVTFAGQSGYLDLWTNQGSGSDSIYSVWLSKSSTEANKFFASKNITTNASNSSVVVLMDYQVANGHYTNMPLATMLSDANYKDAKLIVQSMAY